MNRTALENCTEEALREIWRVLAGRGGKPGQSEPAKFSESQSREFERVKKYVEANRRELERVSPGAADSMLSTFGDAIRRGYSASELLPRGA